MIKEFIDNLKEKHSFILSPTFVISFSLFTPSIFEIV